MKNTPEDLQHLVRDTSLLDKVHQSLAGFVQRQAAFELQKAVALNIMVTVMHDRKYIILEAARLAADCCRFNMETIRLFAASFFLAASTSSQDEINEDEYIAGVLESN